MTNDIYFNLASYLHSLGKKYTHYYEEGSQYLVFENSTKKEIKEDYLLNLVYEWRGENELAIQLQTTDYLFFYNQAHFLKDFQLKHTKKDFAILFIDSGLLFFNSLTQKVENKKEKINDQNLIINTIYYLKTLQLFSETNFCNYIDRSIQKIILTTGKKGTIAIGYPISTPAFPSNYYLKDTYTKLIERWKVKGYMYFFKSEIFDFIQRIPKEQERLIEIIKNLDYLIENSDRNFEVYISDFSFENFKQNFQTEKEKYFSSIRDLLSKLSSQATALPISISASAFASYKLNDPITLVLIILGFSTHGIYITYTLFSIRKDLKEIEADFTRDKDKILDKKILVDQDIHYQLDRVSKKIRKAKYTTRLFSFVLIFLSILFIGYLIFQLIQKQP